MAFVNVRNKKRTVKVLFIGPSGAGKTFPGLQLPGNIGVYDGEDGVRAYMDMFTFGVDPFDTIDELNTKIDELLKDGEALTSVDSIVIDGLTTAWHEALNAVVNDNGQIGFEKQRDLKGGFKDLNLAIFKLGKRDKNVWATAQSKVKWEVVRGQAPKPAGHKGDIDDRIWFAFDLVGYVEKQEDGTRKVLWLKSRFPQVFQVGDETQRFDLKKHFAPIFDGTAKYVEEGEDGTAIEMNRARDQIKAKVRELGPKGAGKLPTDVAKRLWAVAEDQGKTLAELGEALKELRAAEQVEAAVAA